jgi:hypothetical protein
MKNFKALIFTFFTFIILPAVGHCQFANIAFRSMHISKLKFITTAQSILASNCSAAVTVQTFNSANVATNVTSNLTINLNTTGSLTFFSDINCTTPITVTVISSGSSTQTFYFIDTAVATNTMTASASGYTSASQSASTATNPYVWTGGGGDSNWSTNANWSGGAAPGAGNVAIFNGVCTVNCSPSISSNMSIYGVRMDSSYSGTITQGSGRTMTVGSKGWVQLNGVFIGSNANLTIYDNLKVTAGSFQATSATLTFLPSGPYTATTYSMGNAVTFSANGGVFYFNPGSAYHSFNPGTAVYNTFKISSIGGYVFFENGNMNVAGDLILDTTQYTNSLNAGTISVSGNVAGIGYYAGSAIIKLIGNAAGQTITMNAGSMVPSLTLETGTNPVTLSGTGILQGNLLVSSVGTFTSTGSTLTFFDNCGSTSLTPGSITFNNVVFDTQCGNFNLNSGTLNVAGNLSFNSPGYNGSINSGTISVSGNISSTGPSVWGGSAIVKVAGNASGQTVSGTSNGHLPNLTVAAGVNPVTVSGQLIMHHYVMTSVGTFTSTGSSIRIKGNLTTGSESYNNVYLGGGCVGAQTLAGNMNISGNLTLNDTCSSSINGGNLYVAGNATVDSFNGGNSGMIFNGTSQQTLTQSAGNFPSGNITVNNASGIKLATNVNFNGGTQTTSVTTGPIDLAGFNFNLHALNLNGNVLTKNSGALVVNAVTAGTGALFGGTVNP